MPKKLMSTGYDNVRLIGPRRQAGMLELFGMLIIALTQTDFLTKE